MGPMIMYVEGVPAPQGSKRHVGNGRMIESSKKLKPWREQVSRQFREEFGEERQLEGAAVVRLAFVMPRPKSTPKLRFVWAIKRPDGDKLARAVLDGITGLAFKDDSQVVRLIADKRLAEIDEPTGVHICVREALPEDRIGYL